MAVGPRNLVSDVAMCDEAGGVVVVSERKAHWRGFADQIDSRQAASRTFKFEEGATTRGKEDRIQKVHKVLSRQFHFARCDMLFDVFRIAHAPPVCLEACNADGMRLCGSRPWQFQA